MKLSEIVNKKLSARALTDYSDPTTHFYRVGCSYHLPPTATFAFGILIIDGKRGGYRAHTCGFRVMWEDGT